MPSDVKDEGLVLRSFDYKDRQKILTLFTLNRGVVSLIVKGISRKKSHLLTLTSPFTHGEYLFRIHRSNLYTFLDGSPLNTHHNLRRTLPLITAATAVAQAITSSQLPEKPAPQLYQLTLTYLKHLPEFNDPQILVSSYFLKLLKHDGHLALNPTCASCNNSSTHLHQGESYCHVHAPPLAICFTSSEWSCLEHLLHARKITTLQMLKSDPELHTKIEKIFT